jgi:hypothetical protein
VGVGEGSEPGKSSRDILPSREAKNGTYRTIILTAVTEIVNTTLLSESGAMRVVRPILSIYFTVPVLFGFGHRYVGAIHTGETGARNLGNTGHGIANYG